MNQNGLSQLEMEKNPQLKWTRNIKLYGKYIAFLNLDNNTKDQKIRDLQYELREAKDTLQKEV